VIACGKPDAIYSIFRCLCQDPSVTSKEQIVRLSSRLKDLLMKQWTLIGIPLVISAVPHLAKATMEALAVHTSSNQANTDVDDETSSSLPTIAKQMEDSTYSPKLLDATTEEHGYAFMKTIYRHNLPVIMKTWGHHQADFEWLEKRIIYGLFLSDHSILSSIEAELVTLSSIMAQGLRQPSLWHVRGLMRMGVSMEDTESVCDVVKEVAKWAGKSGTDEWIKASEVDVEMDVKNVDGP
jgi:hypothetical protein